MCEAPAAFTPARFVGVNFVVFPPWGLVKWWRHEVGKHHGAEIVSVDKGIRLYVLGM